MQVILYFDQGFIICYVWCPTLHLYGRMCFSTFIFVWNNCAFGLMQFIHTVVTYGLYGQQCINLIGSWWTVNIRFYEPFKFIHLMVSFCFSKSDMNFKLMRSVELTINSDGFILKLESIYFACLTTLINFSFLDFISKKMKLVHKICFWFFSHVTFSDCGKIIKYKETKALTSLYCRVDFLGRPLCCYLCVWAWGGVGFVNLRGCGKLEERILRPFNGDDVWL